MPVLKRLTVWLVETCLEALLLGVFLALRFGYDPHAFLKDIFIYAACVAIMFFMTGYLLSTILIRTLYKGRKWWSYSVIAPVLAIIHYEILDVSIGGAFDPKDRLPVRAAIASITFACTLAGTFALREWNAPGQVP
jgi:hypothetical protein